MSNLLVEDETLETEESYDMGSFNHSYLQLRLGKLLDNQKYTALTDLSLDVSGLDLDKFAIKAKGELKPDVCIYPKRKMKRLNDVLRMSEMPLLAIEVLSPLQSTYEIVQKFKVYFALGIKSCWLVDPALNSVAVYSSIHHWKIFNSGDVIDEVLDIRLPIQDIFDYEES